MSVKLKDLEMEALHGESAIAALEELPEVIAKKEKLLEELDFDIITYDSFFDQSKDQTILHCRHCQHNWIIPDNKSYNNYSSYYYSRNSMRKPDTETCPNCKKEYKVYKVGRKIKELYSLSIIKSYDKENQFAVISTFNISFNHNPNKEREDCYYDGENTDYLQGTLEITIVKAYDSIFSFKYGIRPSSNFARYNNGITNILSSNHSEFGESKANLLKIQLIENDNSRNLFESLSGTYPEAETLCDIFEIIDNNIAKQKEKKLKKSVETRKKNNSNEYYKNYEAKEVSDEELINSLKEGKASSIGEIMSICYSEIGRVRKYLSACSCGNIFESEKSDSYDLITCPICGAKENQYGNSRKDSFIISDLTGLLYELVESTGDLLLRVFTIRKVLSYETKQVKYIIKEDYRAFITEKSVICYSHYNDEWEKERVNCIDKFCGRYYYSNGHFVINTKESLTEIIKASNLKYSGLLEAWGLKPASDGRCLEIESPGEFNRNGYLYTRIKAPYVEQILKTGLINATKDVMSNTEQPVNKQGTTIYDILGINKITFKMIRAKNPHISEIMEFKTIWELDTTVTIEDYEKLSELNDFKTIITIHKDFNVGFKKLLEYIDSCYNNQCIEKRDALRIWYDYLKMAKDMEYRLNDNAHKYPASLKKEHDRAVFPYKVVKDQINTKRFIEQAEINKSRLDYSFEKLFIRVPMNPNEVIKEGTDQKHCVASYVNQIASGSTAVCFIRRKDEPDVSYFTVEVCDDKIVQVRGYCNCAPRDKDLLIFIRKWAERKKLKINY